MKPLHVTVSLVLLTGLAHPADWPQWRGPQRTGVSPHSPALVDSLPASGPRLLWEVELPKAGKEANYSSPVAAQGRVFFKLLIPGEETAPAIDGEKKKDPSVDDGLVCVDLASGKELWRVRHAGGGAKWKAPNSPCVSAGKVYYVNSQADVVCLDAGSGKELWKTATGVKGGSFAGSLLVIGGKVIVSDKKLSAFDAVTGAKAWEANVAGENSSPTMWTHAGQPYVIAGGHELACVVPGDGKVLWKIAVGKGPSSPVVHGDRLALLREDNTLSLFQLSLTGAELLAKETIEAASDGHNACSPVFNGAFVYGTDKAKTFAYDVEKKMFAWQGEKPGDAKPSPILADGKIIFGGKGKTGLLILDATTGKTLARAAIAPASCTSFALVDGKLLVNAGSHLRCYALTK